MDYWNWIREMLLAQRDFEEFMKILDQVDFDD